MPVAERPRHAGAGDHTALMREIGSRDGYDPIPCSQVRYMMDRSQPPTVRLLGWTMLYTIHKGTRTERTAYAYDPKRGWLTLKHAAADLDLSLSNASSYAKELEQEGRIKRDDKGRISLRGDVPAPQLTGDSDEAPETPETPETPDEQIIRLLSRLRVTQDFAEFVARQQHKTRHNTIRKMEEMQQIQRGIQSQFVAQVREITDEMQAALYASIGYEPPEEKRGRPRKALDGVQFPTDPAEARLLLQKTFESIDSEFLQNNEELTETKKSELIDITPPYKAEIQSYRVSECDETEAPEDTHPPTPEPANATRPDENREQLLETLAGVGFPIEDSDPLANKFQALIETHQVDGAILCHAIRTKADSKGDYLQSAGALYQFVAKDFEQLLARTRRNAPGSRLDQGRPLETSEAMTDQQRAYYEGVLADPATSEAEKNIARNALAVEARSRSASAGG